MKIINIEDSQQGKTVQQCICGLNKVRDDTQNRDSQNRTKEENTKKNAIGKLTKKSIHPHDLTRYPIQTV